jgi:hypothetical protein
MSYVAEHVRAFLSEQLMPLGLDPDGLFVNEVADVLDLEVVRTRTVVEESLHWLALGEEPTYDQGLIGLFHQPATFDPAHRAGGLRLPDLEKLIGQMLVSLG